jgi:glycine/sarcosine N-methyltransferase
MLTFYEEIAPYYEQIFPLQKSQVAFVKRTFKQFGETKLLEVGCGIGLLSFALVSPQVKVAAFDLDQGMIKEATKAMKKLPVKPANLEFSKLNMLDIGKTFENASFDGVLCFGNTLVHLQSQENVLSFLKQARKVLKPSGILLFQILNYYILLNHKITSLPLIENDLISFDRFYSYPSHSDTINFRTILTIKKGNQKFEHNIPLLPLGKKEIESLLIQAGFEKYSLYGSYEMDPFTPDSDSLVVKADGK